MDIELRKDSIIEFLRLGMDLDTAYVAADVPFELRESLEQDEEFQHRINYTLANLEATLLRRLQMASESSASQGNSRATEKLLEVIKPQRYSRTTKLAHSLNTATGKAPPRISVEFVGMEGADATEED